MAQNPLNFSGMTELKSRILFLLGALIVFRLGAHIPVPGIDPLELKKLFDSQSGGILGMFNMFSGGALSRFTVFALGIMPYISASIIMNLLQAMSPSLKELKKEGKSGQEKIAKYTIQGTLVLAAFQSLGISVALEAQPGLVLGSRFYVPYHCNVDFSYWNNVLSMAWNSDYIPWNRQWYFYDYLCWYCCRTSKRSWKHLRAC